MSTKGENVAYFADGHTEAITDFEFSKDGHHDIWFTTESGRWFLYKEELVCRDTERKIYYPECKFYEIHIDRECVDEFGLTCDIQYLITYEIASIRICAVG